MTLGNNLKSISAKLAKGLAILLLVTSNAQAEYLIPPEDEQMRAIFLPFYHTTMSSQVNAKIQKVFKRMGDSFEQGEVLIQQEPQVFKASLDRAKAAVSKTEAELKGRQELYSKNIVSYFDLKAAEANLATAISELVNAETLFNSTSSKAPYKGKVVNLFTEEGEFAQEGRNLIEIIYDEELLARVLVPTKDLKQFEKGKEFTIKIPEVGITTRGKVYRIDAAINPSSSLIKVDILVSNKDQKIISGMVGEVVVEQPKRAILEERTHRTESKTQQKPVKQPPAQTTPPKTAPSLENAPKTQNSTQGNRRSSNA